MRAWLRKLFFDLYYLGSPPWDTGITPPEVLEFIESHAAGRALDLGCGTGTNVIALAQAGWQAEGVDFSRRAIRMARNKARREGVDVRFHRDDVSRLRAITGAFDLILDIGCFHSIAPDRHADYAQNLVNHLAPGGTFMLYVFFRNPDSTGPGTTEAELDAAFAPLRQLRREEGSERGERRSAWLWFSLPDDPSQF